MKHNEKEIEWTTEDLPIKQLKPAQYNPRKMTEADYANLKKSLQNFGHAYPVVVNKDLTIIGGHQTVRAAQELGYKTLQVSRPSRKLDSDEEKALNLALNRIHGEFDLDQLEVVLKSFSEGFDKSLTGFGDIEIEALIKGIDVDFSFQPSEEAPEGPPQIEGESENRGFVCYIAFTLKEEAEAFLRALQYPEPEFKQGKTKMVYGDKIIFPKP